MKTKRKSAVQSLGRFLMLIQKRLEAVHSTWKTWMGAEKKVLCFAQKYQYQTEVPGVISWMTGSMANPCISQWNCSADKDLSSAEERGHVKCPDSTRL